MIVMFPQSSLKTVFLKWNISILLAMMGKKSVFHFWVHAIFVKLVKMLSHSVKSANKYCNNYYVSHCYVTISDKYGIDYVCIVWMNNWISGKLLIIFTKTYGILIDYMKCVHVFQVHHISVNKVSLLLSHWNVALGRYSFLSFLWF